MLLCPQSPLQYIRGEVKFQIERVYRNTKYAPNDDTQKHKTHLSNSETIFLYVHQRKYFKVGVVDAIHDHGIDVDESKGWVFEANFQRLDDGV
jgi:hypothetical protein